MILFMNVFITDKRHPHYNVYNRGLYPPVSPYEQLKYTLASMAVIPFSKVFIYCLMDDNYQYHTDLSDHVYYMFPNVELHFHRNEKQSQWKEALAEVMDRNELVWFTGNHDHVFIDYNLDVLNKITGDMMKSEDRNVSCYFSHWPEALNRTRIDPVIHKDSSYFILTTPENDSIEILSKEVLRRWWWDNDYGEQLIPRTDWRVERYPLNLYVPMREMVRHFDGYDRAGNMACDINGCSPLFIPPGFWEKKIKISYGKRLPGHVYVDPRKEHSSKVEGGADMRCMLDDLPLFWRDRIETIESEDIIDEVAYRNEAVRQKASATIGHIPTWDELGISFR